MAEDAQGGDAGASERLRGFVARARRAPATLEDLGHQVDDLGAALVEVRAHLDRLEALAWAGRNDTTGGVTAVGEELHALDARIDALAHDVEGIDATVAAHATALHRAVAAPGRQTAARALLNVLGPPTPVVPGLSVFTLAWNHGELLGDAIDSGLACLDRLPAGEQGELLVLDDASSDATPAITGAAAARDPRVRVIRSSVNLGLALARSTLLHTARTTHAFHLDADNVAEPEGVEALYRAARATGAAVTYGTVVQVGPDGVAVGPISNEPPTPALFRSNYVDTMAVTDVEAMRRLGGWSPDPLLEHVDDWAAIHRVVQADLLVAFVPVLAGHYRLLGTAFHRSVGDPRIGAARVARTFDPTGRLQGDGALDRVVAVTWDPIAGPLWATPAATSRRPDLAPATPEPPAAPDVADLDRVLVVAPGGVRNLGDDAITEAGLHRLRDVLGPRVAIDLLTDGPDLSPGIEGVRWIAPLVDAVAGLDYDQLGRLDAALARAAEERRVGEARWRPLRPLPWRAAVFLGGGTLASGWTDGLVAPRAILAAALRAAEVPYVLSGQGLGPLDAGADRELVAGLLAGARAVACRDEASAALARSLPGVDPTRVEVTGDDAIATGGASVTAGRPYLAVTVRRATYVAGAEDLAVRWFRAADALAAERGWDVVGVALNDQGPEPEVATLATLLTTEATAARWRIVDCGRSPERLATAIGAAHAVAAQSFHAALFGLAAARPTVLARGSAYYDAKAVGLAARAALPEALAVRDPDAMGPALDLVAAALMARPAPLAEARAAVDRWWARLPELLGARVSG